MDQEAGSFVPTEDPTIDGLLSGFAWTQPDVSYGFPAGEGFYPGGSSPYPVFSPASDAMQRAIRGFVEGAGSSDTMTLTPIKGFTNLDLTESPMIATGADILIAHSTRASTAFTFFPDGNEHPGDVWFGSNESLRTPSVGTWAYFVAMHEFGHALGLKHPHDGTSLNPAAMPMLHDDHQHTVMSYNSHSTSAPVGLTTNELFGYPQTYMADDIAALQTLYGANYGFRADDTTYRWNPETGEVFVNGQSRGRPGTGDGDPVENRIFQTIWDGGGADTYDLSAYAKGVSIDLNPGASSTFSRDQVAVLAYSLSGGSGFVEADGNVTNARLHDGDTRSLIENARGGRGADRIAGNVAANVLSGGEGDDTLQGGPGDDVLSGGDGTNVAVFAGPRGDYDVAERPGGLLAVIDHQADRDGADVLGLVKYGQFADGMVRLLPNTAPIAIERTQNSVLDGSRKGTTVARLSAQDADDSHFHYALAPHSSGLFAISGNRLVLRKSADYDDHRILHVAVKATDPDGLSVTKAMTFYVARVVDGTTARDALAGTPGGDKISGFGGNDRLAGGSGNDTLSGGAGRDGFLFDTRLDANVNVDRILDFSVPDDTIRLAKGIFKALGTHGALDEQAFWSGARAHDRSDRILYDKGTGTLLYDPDGSGRSKAVPFVKVDKASVLTHADFFVV
ncbi:MAG: M10 family metallopeptidase C-terminal domain-containing protein [Microvirga sp.]